MDTRAAGAWPAYTSVGRRGALAGWIAALVVLASLALVLWAADLEPRVEPDFFFARDDAAVADGAAIGERFAARPQLFVAATGEDVLAADYLERLERLGEELAALEGIATVRSLTAGPPSPQAAVHGPLWSRLLLSQAPEDLGDTATGPPLRTSLLIAELDASDLENGEPAPIVARVEAILDRHHRPSFSLEASGVPWVVEQIRRHLARDLRIFTLASLLVFGVLVAAIYRSAAVVLGVLATCLGACATTLAILHLLGSPIGLLTANIVTITFVLTLSHLVFLTARWRRRWAAGEEDAIGEAIRRTFGASCWAMATTLLGFLSLRWANAQPLRELGSAGAVGTIVAITLAYTLYPAILLRARRPPGDAAAAGGADFGPAIASRLLRGGGPALVVLAVAVAVTAFGLPRLDTDPPLLDYFDPGGDIRPALERIDRVGGSSPLLLTLHDPEGGRFDEADPIRRLGALQQRLEQDPAVGVALSLSVLLDEARRFPLASFLSTPQLLGLLDSPQLGSVAAGFVDSERRETMVLLRMRETVTDDTRRQVIERLHRLAAEEGLRVTATGGLYPLQTELGELVSRSLWRGLGGLLLLFVAVAALVARALRPAAAMVAGLAALPILVLGTLGLLGVSLDIVSSPAANIAMALGIDSMIHLTTTMRRRRDAGDEATAAWRAALAELGPAVAGAALVLAAGFGIFALSSFPPTRRFGLAVACGTLAAAAISLLVLPRLAGAGSTSQESKIARADSVPASSV